MIPLMGERHFNYDAAGTRLHPMDEDLSLGTPECIAKGSLTSFSCNFATNGFAATTSWVLGPGGEQVTEYVVSGALFSITRVSRPASTLPQIPHPPIADNSLQPAYSIHIAPPLSRPCPESLSP